MSEARRAHHRHPDGAAHESPDDDGAAATVKALIGESERGKGLIEDHIEDVELDQLDRREPLHGIGTHEGAKKHLEARNPTVLWGGLFALGLLVAHARRNPGSFRRGLAARSYMLVLSGSLTGVWLMLSLAMMRAKATSTEIPTLGASFRHTFQIVARMSDDRLITPGPMRSMAHSLARHTWMRCPDSISAIIRCRP